jgi:hypothetical protein
MTLEQACPSEYQRAQCAFKDSMTHWNSAIRITYRISLRSSSMPEPRDPLLKVLLLIYQYLGHKRHDSFRVLKRLAIGGRWPEDAFQRSSGGRGDGSAEATEGSVNKGLGGRA